MAYSHERSVSSIFEQTLNREATRKSFRKGDIIKVVRTSGEIEDGWVIKNFDQKTGRVIVHDSTDKYKKEIPQTELYDLNSKVKTFYEWHKIWLAAGGHITAMFDANLFPFKMSAEEAWKKLKGGRVELTKSTNPEKIFKSYFDSQSEEVGGNNYDKIDDIITNRLDNPLVIKGKSGTMVLATDEGINYKPHNEDAVIVNNELNFFAVVDGMGGMGEGDKAAKILAEELQKGWQAKKIPTIIQQEAHQRMRREKIGVGGACYIASQINKDNLIISQSGDVRLIVVGSNGRVKFSTTDEGIFEGVSNAVQGTEPGQTTISQVQLQKGDRVIVASDGVFDNFYPVPYQNFRNAIVNGKFTYQEAINSANQKLAKLIDRKSPVEAIKLINQTLAKEMTGAGKPDNRAIIIYDIEQLEK